MVKTFDTVFTAVLRFTTSQKMQAGILDPVKMTRTALQNATSVASTLLTTEAAAGDIKELAPAAPAGAGEMDY